MIINQVAPLCAALCERYGIPVHFLTADDLRAGDRVGITSHREITYAFVKGGHTDPGPDYPWDQLLSEISKNLGGQAPAPQPPQTPNPSTDVFGPGSTGNKVKTIQALVGVAQDGVYGPKTQAAVTVWQRNLNIPADGIWGPRTDEATAQFFVWLSSQNHHPASGEGDAFLAAIASATSQILKGGSQGGAVKILQGSLNLKGYPLVQDGIFGPATDSAVRWYQRNNGLTVDGIVGPNTWKSIFA